MKLNEIRDNPKARTKKVRVGRGPGSGVGKTSGKGHKGQLARTGVAVRSFEGGQMPLHRRLPKRGFHNIFRKDFTVVNLNRVQLAIDAGRLDAGAAITVDALQAAGLFKIAGDGGVKLLGEGEIKSKVTIEVQRASKSAIAAVEKVGGTVTVLAPPAVKEPPPKKVYKVEEEPKGKPAKGAKEKAPKQAEGDKAGGDKPAPKPRAKPAADKAEPKPKS